MIALFSRWKLKDGCPPELSAALDKLAAEVEAQEPGTLVYALSFPGSNPPIGPPPDYAVDPDFTPAPADQNELLFFEVYRDAQAFSDHIRGAVATFMKLNRHYFATPWQGHPRPEITYLDPQSLLVRSALVRETVGT